MSSARLLIPSGLSWLPSVLTTSHPHGNSSGWWDDLGLGVERRAGREGGGVTEVRRGWGIRVNFCGDPLSGGAWLVWVI